MNEEVNDQANKVADMEIIYSDAYVIIKDPGEGLINITPLKKRNRNRVSAEEEIPEHALPICGVLNITFKELETLSVEDVKLRLKNISLKAGKRG